MFSAGTANTYNIHVQSVNRQAFKYYYFTLIIKCYVFSKRKITTSHFIATSSIILRVSATRDYADLDLPALNGNSSTIVKSTFMKSLISINKLYFVLKSILQNYSMFSNCSNTVIIPGFYMLH